MRQIECRLKSYAITHHYDESTKPYSHTLFALAAKRPDAGYDIVIELGKFNKKTHKYMKGKLTEGLNKLDLVLDDAKLEEIDNILRKYAGLPHTKTIPVIKFGYTNDLTLYEAIGSFAYLKSDEYKIQSITNLAKNKSEFIKYLNEHYKIEPKTEPIILEVD